MLRYRRISGARLEHLELGPGAQLTGGHEAEPDAAVELLRVCDCSVKLRHLQGLPARLLCCKAGPCCRCGKSAVVTLHRRADGQLA